MDINTLTNNGPWAIAAAQFVPTMYLQAPLGSTGNTLSTGFSIVPSAAVIISFEGTYTGQTVTHQQTLDEDGASGWFNVSGVASDGSGASATGSTADTAYIFTAEGVRHRMVVSALASGTIKARVKLAYESLGSSTGAGGGGGGDATAANQLTEISLLSSINSELGVAPTSIPPINPRFYGGTLVISGAGLQRVPVGFASASAQTIAASDANNTWAVFGWELSFTGTPTYPFSMTLTNGGSNFVIKIPQTGIYSGVYTGTPYAQCSGSSTAMTVTISDANARVDGFFIYGGGQ